MDIQQAIREANAAITRRLRALEAADKGLGGNNAGADTRVIGTQLVRAGSGVLLFSSAGALLSEFAFTNAGVLGAMAAASYGDLVELPAGIVVGDFAVPSGVTVRGIARDVSTVDGCITLADVSSVENLSVIRVYAQGNALIGVTVGASGTSRLVNVVIRVENIKSNAWAVALTEGGNLDAYEAILIAEVGKPGYAAYVTSGVFKHFSGRAIGSIPTYPYYM
jgi:hypothetical protein